MCRILAFLLLAFLLSPLALAQQRQAAEPSPTTSPLIAPGHERPDPAPASVRFDPVTGRPVRPPEVEASARARAEARRRAALERLDALRRLEPDPPKQRTPYAGTPSGEALRGGPTFLVNSAWDDPDTSPGDGICYTGYFGDECTLRAAIEEVNATAGTDPVRIEFDFVYGPTGSEIAPGVWMLQVNHPFTSAGHLPTITRANTTVDGLTQPGASCGDLVGGVPHDLGVVLDGSLAITSLGYLLKGDENGFVVRGLVVQNFFDGGIASNGSGSLIECNYVGVDYTGEVAAPTDWGVGVFGPPAVPTNTWVQNNLISGNEGLGIFVEADAVGVSQNLVGTDKDGSQPIPNGTFGLFAGIHVQFSSDVIVDANVVSGNAADGIRMAGRSQRAQVTRNTVGLARTGADLGLGNGGFGIYIVGGASDNDIGLPGASNYVAASGSGTYTGIAVEINAPSGNRIRGNVVGLDASGNPAPNFQGIGVVDDGTGAPSGTVIGGSGLGEGNVVSGNVEWGLLLADDADTLVEGNLIGLDFPSLEARPNGAGGVLLDGSAAPVLRGNVVAGNGGPGVALMDLFLSTVPTTGAILEGNHLGTDVAGTLDRGNANDGVLCLKANDTRVGGTAPGLANTIAFNGAASPGSDGVFTNATNCVNVALLGNAVYGNAELGIDHCPAGGCDVVTPNDSPDADGVTNYPVITSAGNDGADAVIALTLDALPSQPYRVELFTSTAPDPSGYGEGETWRAATEVLTGASGTASEVLVRPAADFPVGAWVTATATPVDGGTPTGFRSTSEFSAAVEVQDTSGPPLTVTLTPTNPPPPEPIVLARRQRLYYDLTFEVGPTGPSSFAYWTEAVLPNGNTRSPLLGPNMLVVSPPQTVTLSYSQRVPRGAPLGDYTYRVEAGTFPGPVLASDEIAVQVVASKLAAREDENGSDVWLAFDAEGRVVEAGHVLDFRDPAGAAAAAERGSSAAGPTEGTVPDAFALHAPYPNPARGEATVRFDVPKAAPVRLTVYDVLGRAVAVLADGVLEAGRHAVRFGAAGLPSGVYLVRFEGGGAAQVRRLTLLR